MLAFSRLLEHAAPALHHLAGAVTNQVVQFVLQAGLQAWVSGT